MPKDFTKTVYTPKKTYNVTVGTFQQLSFSPKFNIYYK